jgi:hypothetical protein
MRASLIRPERLPELDRPVRLIGFGPRLLPAAPEPLRLPDLLVDELVCEICVEGWVHDDLRRLL